MRDILCGATFLQIIWQLFISIGNLSAVTGVCSPRLLCQRINTVLSDNNRAAAAAVNDSYRDQHLAIGDSSPAGLPSQYVAVCLLLADRHQLCTAEPSQFSQLTRTYVVCDCTSFQKSLIMVLTACCSFQLHVDALLHDYGNFLFNWNDDDCGLLNNTFAWFRPACEAAVRAHRHNFDDVTLPEVRCGQEIYLVYAELPLHLFLFNYEFLTLHLAYVTSNSFCPQFKLFQKTQSALNRQRDHRVSGSLPTKRSCKCLCRPCDFNKENIDPNHPPAKRIRSNCLPI
jgi:hypothetical protein